MEKVRTEKMQVREKVGKSRNTVFCYCFVALEGQKVGSLKRGVRSQLAGWKMKHCTPLWREPPIGFLSLNFRHRLVRYILVNALYVDNLWI